MQSSTVQVSMLNFQEFSLKVSEHDRSSPCAYYLGDKTEFLFDEN